MQNYLYYSDWHNGRYWRSSVNGHTTTTDTRGSFTAASDGVVQFHDHVGKSLAYRQYLNSCFEITSNPPVPHMLAITKIVGSWNCSESQCWSDNNKRDLVCVSFFVEWSGKGFPIPEVSSVRRHNLKQSTTPNFTFPNLFSTPRKNNRASSSSVMSVEEVITPLGSRQMPRTSSIFKNSFSGNLVLDHHPRSTSSGLKWRHRQFNPEPHCEGKRITTWHNSQQSIMSSYSEKKDCMSKIATSEFSVSS